MGIPAQTASTKPQLNTRRRPALIAFANADGLRDYRPPASVAIRIRDAWPQPSSFVWVVFALGIATGLLLSWAWVIWWTAA